MRNLNYNIKANRVYDCQPKHIQKELSEFLNERGENVGAEKIISLNEHTMIREDMETGKKTTFIKINEN